MAAVNRTSGLTEEMMLYYEKVFLARAEYKLVLEQGAQKKTHGGGQGKSIVFTRYTPLALQTTALSEGVNPPSSSISAANVSCTLAEYGLTLKVSKFLSLTSIDVNNKEKIELLGQNMGETLNRLVRSQLSTGTKYYANGAKTSTIASSDTIDAADIAAVVENLELNKAMKYPDGFFLGKFAPQVKADLIQDSTWVNAKTYSDVKDLYKGEMGELYGVRCLLNTDYASAAGTGSSSDVTYYQNYIHGAQSFGVYDLEKDTPKLYIVPNQVDSGNPAGRLSYISWAGSYVAKVLNSNWIYMFGAVS